MFPVFESRRISHFKEVKYWHWNLQQSGVHKGEKEKKGCRSVVLPQVSKQRSLLCPFGCVRMIRYDKSLFVGSVLVASEVSRVIMASEAFIPRWSWNCPLRWRCLGKLDGWTIFQHFAFGRFSSASQVVWVETSVFWIALLLHLFDASCSIRSMGAQSPEDWGDGLEYKLGLL